MNKSETSKQIAHNQNVATLQTQAQAYLWQEEITVPQANIIDDMVTKGYIKEVPNNPLGTGAYVVAVSASGVATVTPIIVEVTGIASGGEPEPPVVANVAVGKYIKFGSYNGQPIVWRVIHKQDIDGDTNDDLMLFADRIISLKAFDATGDNAEGRGDANRTSYGSNYWEKSNLREWLNSSADAGAVAWSHQAPDNAHVWSNYNEYSVERGFLYSGTGGNFTPEDVSKMVTPTHKVILADWDGAGVTSDADIEKDGGTANHTYNSTITTAVQNYDSAYYEDIADDKVFLLGIKELYDYVYNNATLGDGTTWYIGKTTAQARSNSEYTSGSLDDDNDPWYYWLRDSYAPNSCNVRHVNADGAVGTDGAYGGLRGVRPALFLSPSGMTLDGASGASAGDAYTITWE